MPKTDPVFPKCDTHHPKRQITQPLSVDTQRKAFALATVVHDILTGSPLEEGVRNWAMPFRLAHRIAVNRSVAGVHFPVDSAAGAFLGCAIGQAVLGLCKNEQGIVTHFNLEPLNSEHKEGRARSFHAAQDFETTWLRKFCQEDEADRHFELTENSFHGDELLNELWERVEQEH